MIFSTCSEKIFINLEVSIQKNYFKNEDQLKIFSNKDILKRLFRNTCLSMDFFLFIRYDIYWSSCVCGFISNFHSSESELWFFSCHFKNTPYLWCFVISLRNKRGKENLICKKDCWVNELVNKQINLNTYWLYEMTVMMFNRWILNINSIQIRIGWLELLF